MNKINEKQDLKHHASDKIAGIFFLDADLIAP